MFVQLKKGSAVTLPFKDTNQLCFTEQFMNVQSSDK